MECWSTGVMKSEERQFLFENQILQYSISPILHGWSFIQPNEIFFDLSR